MLWKKNAIYGLGLLAVALLVPVVGMAAKFVTMPAAIVPAAAAHEATLVCTSFSGLTSFTITEVPRKVPDPEGLLTYRVTATCKTNHVVSGEILIPGTPVPSTVNEVKP